MEAAPVVRDLHAARASAHRLVCAVAARRPATTWSPVPVRTCTGGGTLKKAPRRLHTRVKSGAKPPPCVHSAWPPCRCARTVSLSVSVYHLHDVELAVAAVARVIGGHHPVRWPQPRRFPRPRPRQFSTDAEPTVLPGGADETRVGFVTALVGDGCASRPVLATGQRARAQDLLRTRTFQIGMRK